MVTIYFHVDFIVVIITEQEDVVPKQRNIKNEQMVNVFDNWINEQFLIYIWNTD